MAHYNAACCLVALIGMIAPLFGASLQAVGKRDADYYTAGVVEFRSGLTWSNNLEAYLEIISSEQANETDIIVFPELTLNTIDTATFVPDPAEQLLLCNHTDANVTEHYHEVLLALSCAARAAGKYIVVNLNEKQVCSENQDDPRPCADDDLNIFNTNVVFDRSGAIISRYRKVHLYGEPRNTTYEPELSYFETDFGVTFGHFICFDILFYTPAHEMILKLGVRDFVYPTMWFSQLPFLTAVQTQMNWAYVNDVNLLAAGASNPYIGSTGTGIFHGRQGTLTSVMNGGVGERKIYVAQVPKYKTKTMTISRQRRAVAPALTQRLTTSDIFLKRDYLENYESKLLDLNSSVSSLKEEVCYDQFCCRFALAWRSLSDVAGNANGSSYSYRLAAYDGPRNEQLVDANYLRNCGIFACTGDEIENCGQIFSAAADQQPQIAFTHLSVEARYPHSRELLLMPNSLLDNLLPLEPAQFSWTQRTLEDSYYYEVSFALNESLELSNLLTFGIYGNYYDDVCTFDDQSDDIVKAKCGYRSAGAAAAFVSSLLILPLALILGRH